MATGPEAAAS